jgi:hypothetical protein
MSSNRQFIHTQLEAAWQARRSGNRDLAIRTLIHAIAEGDGTTEENLRVLVEEAGRRRNQEPVAE